MSERLRKLVGTIVLIVFVCIYALTAMTIAAAKLPGTSGWVQLVFFIVAGLIWVIPAAALIVWMQKPDRTALSAAPRILFLSFQRPGLRSTSGRLDVLVEAVERDAREPLPASCAGT